MSSYRISNIEWAYPFENTITFGSFNTTTSENKSEVAREIEAFLGRRDNGGVYCTRSVVAHAEYFYGNALTVLQPGHLLRIFAFLDNSWKTFFKVSALSRGFRRVVKKVSLFSNYMASCP